MIPFAVQTEGDEPDKGRWVLAVDVAGERFLVGNDDQTLRWVPMAQCKVVKVSHPDMPKPVFVAQAAPAAPKLAIPHLQMNGGGRGR